MPRVAAAHCAPVALDKPAGITLACETIARAGAEEVELLVFPETFIPGFPYWINLYPPGQQHPMYVTYLAQSVDIAAGELEPVCQAARDAGVAVVLGLSERVGSTMFNAQAFIAADGNLTGVHRKLQPTYAERMLWGRGDGSGLFVADWPVGRTGGLICYEHMLNLPRQALIDMGEQIHCASWPTFAPLSTRGGAYDRQVEVLMSAHALTAQCFVVMAQNHITPAYIERMQAELGPQTSLGTGGGRSAIWGPDGSLLAASPDGAGDMLVIADLDLFANDRARP
ncbi:carbon-nitrogen hydrolase family protein [Rhodobacteraceae bacterium D3-12]|nr:carbon-nitrogen hydrolase family protein [Rhodobacteraceae bacterium D3-12]